MIWYDVIRYDMIWYDVTWCDMIWYDMMWFDWYVMIWISCPILSYHMIWYSIDIMSYLIMPYDMIWCSYSFRLFFSSTRSVFISLSLRLSFFFTHRGKKWKNKLVLCVYIFYIKLIANLRDKCTFLASFLPSFYLFPSPSRRFNHLITMQQGR